MTTYDTTKAAFLVLVQSLAVHFPDYELVTPEGHWNVYFQNKNEPSKGFYLSPDNNKGKFTVSPKIVKTPHHSIGDVYGSDNKKIDSPSVGFSVDRPVDQIAKGIKARFFPDFEIYYSNWMRVWNDHNNYANGKESTAKEIAKVLELSIDATHDTCEKVRSEFSTYRSENSNLKTFISSVRVSSENGIEIKTNYLNKAQAIKVLEFIKSIQ